MTEDRDYLWDQRGPADAFVVELGCVDGKAQHLHPVFHDLGNTLGRPA